MIRIEQAIELIYSLISTSHSITVFGVKWQIIRDRLEELLSSLNVIANCVSALQNPSFLDSLKPLFGSLKEIEDLAKRCQGFSYSGKLLMQSDLDMVCGVLKKHTKALSLVYNEGLLSMNYAIVLQRPNLGASKDDMKIYVNDLFSRLKVGSSDMKIQALVSFNNVCQEDDKYVKIGVEIEGFVNVLVGFLDATEDGEIQEQGAKACCLIAGFEGYKGVLIGAGAIAPLIRVLEIGTDLGKEFSARCLLKLTENGENAWSVSAHGGVTALLKLCENGGNGENGGEMVTLAAGVLKSLIQVEEIKKFMVEEGVIPLFVKLIRSRDQISAIDFLQAIAFGDGEMKEMVIKEGGIRALVRVFDPKQPASSKAKEVALKGIMNLSLPSPSCFAMLLNYGFLDHILYFLHYGEASVQEMALKAAFWLSGTSDDAKKAMGEAGFMPEVVKFLNSKSLEVCEMAAETLYSMISVPKNRKKFVQSDQNVGFFLQILDQMEIINSGNKRIVLSIIMSLTSFNSARKKIANSSYLKKIEKLAAEPGDNSSDAKKIVRKLSSNRLKSMFSGLWSS